MGQYWMVVNLTKKECINPHQLGCGLKLWEQVANQPSTGTALLILCAAMPEQRGGGDLDLTENWHGPERELPRDNVNPGPMPETYHDIAKRTIGRWAGDRIALVGDYAEDNDLPEEFHAKTIFGRCPYDAAERQELIENGVPESEIYTNVTADVCAVIEHELHGKFVGDGWREWVPEGQEPWRPDNRAAMGLPPERGDAPAAKAATRPDMVVSSGGVKRDTKEGWTLPADATAADILGLLGLI